MVNVQSSWLRGRHVLTSTKVHSMAVAVAVACLIHPASEEARVDKPPALLTSRHNMTQHTDNPFLQRHLQQENKRQVLLPMAMPETCQD